MHLCAHHAHRDDGAIATDDGLHRDHALVAGIAHRLRIDRLDVVDLLRRTNASTDSERSAGRRWPSAWRTPRDDRDRLLQCTDLQGDRLIPIPRLTQFELVAKRAESAARWGE